MSSPISVLSEIFSMNPEATQTCCWTKLDYCFHEEIIHSDGKDCTSSPKFWYLSSVVWLVLSSQEKEVK